MKIEKYHWYILICLSAIIAIGLWATGQTDMKIVGDAPSYLLFDFSTLKGALGGHRTMGLPILVRIYQLFASSFSTWPFLLLGIYFLSVLLLHHAWLKLGLNTTAALIISICLMSNMDVIRYVDNIAVESLAAAALNACMAALVFTIIRRRWYYWVLLTILIFSLYQIRPNLVIVAALIPFWGVRFSHRI